MPISVTKTVKDLPYSKGKDITYKLYEGFKRVGEVWASQSEKRPHRFIVGSFLNKEYRGSGLGKEFYNKLASTAKKLGAKSFVGTTDNVATIGKVRSYVGKTRGFVGKGAFSGTTFVTLLRKIKK